MTEPEVVIHTGNSMMAYPEVTPNATAWAWSDQPNPKGDGTIRVTEHGLRRLLRIASQVYPHVAMNAYEGIAELRQMYAEEVNREAAVKLLNELSSIWCEGDLVMSRLFVDEQGRPIAHKDAEVDAAAVNYVKGSR